MLPGASLSVYPTGGRPSAASPRGMGVWVMWARVLLPCYRAVRGGGDRQDRLLRIDLAVAPLAVGRAHRFGIAARGACLDFGCSGGVAGDLLNTKPEGPWN